MNINNLNYIDIYENNAFNNENIIIKFDDIYKKLNFQELKIGAILNLNELLRNKLEDISFELNKSKERENLLEEEILYEDEKKIFDALTAGATGYLLKSTSPSRLMESITEVFHGGSPMSLSVARRVVQYFSQPKFSQEAEILTKREREILELFFRIKYYHTLTPNPI